MSGLGSKLAVGSVALIVLVAAVDAVRSRRGKDEAATTVPSALAGRQMLVAALRRAGVHGTLVFTNRGCRLSARRLPDLRPVSRPDGLDLGCRFALSPDGRRVAPDGAEWLGGQYAVCHGHGTFVDVLIPPSGRPQWQYDGCAPAWRPTVDEPRGFFELALTVARAGGLVEVRPTCTGQPPCERLVLSQRRLRAAAIRHPATPSNLGLVAGVDAQAVVWLSPELAAVLLRARLSGPARGVGPLQLVALFGGGRLLWTRFDPDASGLDLSPFGTYIVVEPRAILRRDGSQLALPSALERGARAVAWSPDERWLAVATGVSVVVVRTAELERFDSTGRSPRTIVLPLAARDLAWRPGGTVGS